MLLTLCATGIKSHTVEVESFRDASEKMRAFIERHDFGASNLGRACGEIHNAGCLLARVSYNGKVWPPVAWSPDLQPMVLK